MFRLLLTKYNRVKSLTEICDDIIWIAILEALGDHGEEIIDEYLSELQNLGMSFLFVQETPVYQLCQLRRLSYRLHKTLQSQIFLEYPRWPWPIILLLGTYWSRLDG